MDSTYATTGQNPQDDSATAEAEASAASAAPAPAGTGKKARKREVQVQASFLYPFFVLLYDPFGFVSIIHCLGLLARRKSLLKLEVGVRHVGTSDLYPLDYDRLATITTAPILAAAPLRAVQCWVHTTPARGHRLQGRWRSSGKPPRQLPTTRRQWSRNASASRLATVAAGPVRGQA